MSEEYTTKELLSSVTKMEERGEDPDPIFVGDRGMSEIDSEIFVHVFVRLEQKSLCSVAQSSVAWDQMQRSLNY